jgi:hypothetical protein
MRPAKVGTKNNYTGEGQQQFIQPTDLESTDVSEEHAPSIFRIEE